MQIVQGCSHGFTPCSFLYGKARLCEKLICSFLSATSHAIPEIIRLSAASEQHSYLRHHKTILSTFFISSRKGKISWTFSVDPNGSSIALETCIPNTDLNDDYLLFTAPVKSKAFKTPCGVLPCQTGQMTLLKSILHQLQNFSLKYCQRYQAERLRNSKCRGQSKINVFCSLLENSIFWKLNSLQSIVLN